MDDRLAFRRWSSGRIVAEEFDLILKHLSLSLAEGGDAEAAMPSLAGVAHHLLRHDPRLAPVDAAATAALVVGAGQVVENQAPRLPGGSWGTSRPSGRRRALREALAAGRNRRRGSAPGGWRRPPHGITNSVVTIFLPVVRGVGDPPPRDNESPENPGICLLSYSLQMTS